MTEIVERLNQVRKSRSLEISYQQKATFNETVLPPPNRVVKLRLYSQLTVMAETLRRHNRTKQVVPTVYDPGLHHVDRREANSNFACLSFHKSQLTILETQATCS